MHYLIIWCQEVRLPPPLLLLLPLLRLLQLLPLPPLLLRLPNERVSFLWGLVLLPHQTIDRSFRNDRYHHLHHPFLKK